MDLIIPNHMSFDVGHQAASDNFLVYHYSRSDFIRTLYECILHKGTDVFRKPGSIMMSNNSLRAESLEVIGKFVVLDGKLTPRKFRPDEVPSWSPFFRYPGEYEELCYRDLCLNEKRTILVPEYLLRD